MNLKTTLTIILVASTLGIAQTSNTVPETVAHKLQEHQVGLTKAELVSALHNTNSEVRALAAQQLVDEGAKDTTGAIAEALALETEPKARVNIAYALTQLGDERGTAALKQTCAARDTPGWVRVRAASYLATMNDDSCLEDIVALLMSSAEAADRADALAVLPDFKNIPKALAERIDAIVIQGFSDPDPHVRITAADVAATRGHASAIPYLSAAIEKENDVNIKNALLQSRTNLQKKTAQTKH